MILFMSEQRAVYHGVLTAGSPFPPLLDKGVPPGGRRRVGHPAIGRCLVNSSIPGPKSQALARLKEAYVPRGVFNVAPIFLQEGRGARLVDVDGNQFLDFAGGLGVLNVGHCPPAVVDAITAQAGRYLHGCFHVTMYEPYVALAKRLAEITPGHYAKKTLLVNSGAEAVENAVKIARHATGRKAVVCVEHGFHGRTQLTMTLTSKVRPYKFGFGPGAPEVHRMPYGSCYRCSFGLTYPDCELHCAHYLETFLATHLDPAETAAVIVEPVAGEGGFIVPPPEYLPTLQRICRKHGILFIVDEVQTGFGRTGKMFASEHWGLEPDLMVLAKSLAAGLPLGAVVGRAEIMDAPQIGGLGGTFGGNPLACAAALAVIELFEGTDLLDRAGIIGTRVLARMRTWQQELPVIGDVRGLGAMCAMELVTDRTTKIPAKEITARIIKESFKRGLIILKAGVYDNVVRVLMPLVITDQELEDGLNRLEAALRAAVAAAPAETAPRAVAS